MALLDVFDIAGSGMSAQSMRLNLTSSNIANANTVSGNQEEAYSARHAVFSATLKDQFAPTEQGVGVEMLGVVESDAEHVMRYEPNHPMANEKGYVFDSNVDIAEEMANMISSSRSYQNNIEVLNTSKEMLLRTLRLGE
jgi:flagellar basal-body rod protein FlgC